LPHRAKAHTTPEREAFFIVEARGAQLGDIARLLAGGQLRPVVDAIFPLW
jgi:hypothetical protein